MEVEDLEIEAEIERELAELQLDENEIDSSTSGDDVITSVSDEGATTERWSSEDSSSSQPNSQLVSPQKPQSKSAGPNSKHNNVSSWKHFKDEREREIDGSAAEDIWTKLCASNEVAHLLRADLENCSKLLMDAEQKMQQLESSEFSSEMKKLAEKEGKTPEELKNQILKDLAKLEEELELEEEKENVLKMEPADTTTEEHLEIVKLDCSNQIANPNSYFEKDKLVLVPSKSVPGTPATVTVRTPASSGRPDTNMSTGRLSSLANDWDQYLTEIEQEMEVSSHQQFPDVDVEKEAFRRLLTLHKSQKQGHRERERRFLKYRAQLQAISEEKRLKRDRAMSGLQLEKDQLERAKQDLLLSVEREEKNTKDKMDHLQQEHNKYLEGQHQLLQREKQDLQVRKREVEHEREKKETWAAIKIQKCFRGFMSRQKYSLLIKLRKRRVQEWRAMREADAIAEIALQRRENKSKQAEEDERRRKEEKERRREKRERENEEAKRSIKEEEESKRKEREQLRKQHYEEKIKQANHSNEIDKLELEQQAVEVIEKLRSEEKSKVERKVERLLEAKKKQNNGQKGKNKSKQTKPKNAKVVEAVDESLELIGDAEDQFQEKLESSPVDSPNGRSGERVNNPHKIVSNNGTELELSESSDKSGDLKGEVTDDVTSSKAENFSVHSKFDINEELHELIRIPTPEVGIRAQGETTQSEIDGAIDSTNQNLDSSPSEKGSANEVDLSGRNTPRNIVEDGKGEIKVTFQTSFDDNERNFKDAHGIASVEKVTSMEAYKIVDLNGTNVSTILNHETDQEDCGDNFTTNESNDEPVDLSDHNKTFVISETKLIKETATENDNEVNSCLNASEGQNEQLKTVSKMSPNSSSQLVPKIPGKSAAHKESTKKAVAEVSFEAQDDNSELGNRSAATQENNIEDIADEAHNEKVSLLQSEKLEEKSSLLKPTRQGSNDFKPAGSDLLDSTDDSQKSKESLAVNAVLEGRRLQWMNDCIPWTKIKSVQKQAQSSTKARPPVRSAAARKLKAMPTEVILSGSVGHVWALKNVRAVALSELPGYHVGPLNSCVNLQYLVLDQCNMLSLEGLSLCTNLKLIHARHNKLESLCVGEMLNLVELDVSSNRISSLAGLDQCPNLRILNLMDNKISRLGSMVGLRRLQHLNVSTNQLISTRGLSLVSTLTLLDMSANHISSLEEIESLALLQVLNASGNTLQEMPRLCNNVMLRHLDVSCNCLNSVAILSLSYLPLLKTLNIASNGLDSVASLKTEMLLEVLDCSNNHISSVLSLTESLSCLSSLRVLKATENPFTVDHSSTAEIQKSIPTLVELNGAVINSERKSASVIKSQSTFEKVCWSQNETLETIEAAIKVLSSKFKQTDNTEVKDLLQCIEAKESLLNLLHETSVQIREEHEFGETDKVWPELNVESLVQEYKRKCEHIEKDLECFEGKQLPASAREVKSARGRVKSAKREGVANETVQFVRKAWKDAIKDSNNDAATKIQALWKGCLARRRMARIQTQVENEINQMLEQEDIVLLDQDIDLEQFDFDHNELLLDDWQLSLDESPGIAEPNLNQDSLRSEPKSSLTKSRLPLENNRHVMLPTVIETDREKRGERNLTSQSSLDSGGAADHVTGRGFSRDELRDNCSEETMSRIDLEEEEGEGHDPNGHSSSFSARQAKIAQDWGFKSGATAELMLKRAKKMSKTKKHIVTELPHQSRLHTKSSRHSGSTTGGGLSTKRSSLLGEKPNAQPLQPKTFQVATELNVQSPAENYSRVFAWVNHRDDRDKDGVCNSPGLTSGSHLSGTGTAAGLMCSGVGGTAILRTGPPRQIDSPLSASSVTVSHNHHHHHQMTTAATVKGRSETLQSTHNNMPAAQNPTVGSGKNRCVANGANDIDIMSVSDRSFKGAGETKRSATYWGRDSPEPKSNVSLLSAQSHNSFSSASAFLNKTKVLPPINGKYVESVGVGRENTTGWGTGKKSSGKPPRATRPTLSK